MHVLTQYQQIHADTDTIPADTCRYLHFILRNFFV